MINIIGAGPTGIAIAWELSKMNCFDIHLYDTKSSIGGSWWEPLDENRDLHSHRSVFKSYVNTLQFFDEIGLNWDDVFEKSGDNYLRTFFNNLVFQLI